MQCNDAPRCKDTPDMLSGVPFQKTSRTSRAGAAAALPGSGTQAYRILECLRDHPGGLIRQQLMAKCVIKESAACARINRLRTVHHFVFKKGTRESAAGVISDVYFISLSGLRFLKRTQ